MEHLKTEIDKSETLLNGFVFFIGFTDKVDLGAEADNFLKTVSDYTKDLPELEAYQTKKYVIDYGLEQNKVDKPVIITELATQLKEEPPLPAKNSEEISTAKPATKLPDFADFVAKQKPTQKSEIIPDRSKLNQYVRISGLDHKLSMSFSASCLGNSIVYDSQTDNLTIHNISAGLKSRLAKHLNKGS